MSTTPTTIIKKSIGFRTKGLTIQADRGLLAQYVLGSLDKDGNFKEIAEKNYLLSAEDASPIFDLKTKGGSIIDELTEAVAAALSQRPDWLV